MIISSNASVPRGKVKIPPSKSHSIRAVFFASLAEGKSEIYGRLQAEDVNSAIAACRALGADITERGDTLFVRGTGGAIIPREKIIDVGNSGTTALFVLSMASLSSTPVTITGDASTSKRPMQPMLDALSNLGATVLKSDNGKLPVTIQGPIQGGATEVNGETSQYLSSLLIHSGFCSRETSIKVRMLNEKPYVDMTANWMEKLGIDFMRSGYDEFKVMPNQCIKGFKTSVPADFSSATFFLILSAIKGAEVVIEGLDLNDTQGDKKVIDYLRSMGADIECGEVITVRGKKLKGAVLDLNSTPDALPAMAVAACMADGRTELVNVSQARIKETDRISVMASELKKMGADIEEKPDGLVITGSRLKGAKVNGHFDHRVVMALAIAGFVADGETEVSTAEAIKITFPNFVELMNGCHANVLMK